VNLVSGLLGVMLLCAATAVSAQTDATQPPPSKSAEHAEAEAGAARVVKKATRRDPPQTLALTFSLFGAGGTDSQGTAADGVPVSGWYTDADAAAVYRRRLGRAAFGATGRSVLRYAPDRGSVIPMQHQGGLDFSMTGTRHAFHASQDVRYSPYYQFGAMPDALSSLSALSQTAQSHGDFANAGLDALQTMTAVGWSRGISRRGTLSMSYQLRRTTFGRHDFDQTSQGVHFGVTRRLTRYVALRTGYGYRVATGVFSGMRPRNHEIDLGLDYSRALSLSRRTTLGFTSGSSVTPQEHGNAFNVIGAASLTRQIGRTWSARLSVDRSVQLLEGFADPVLTHAVTATLGGALGRDAGISTSISYANGSVGLDADRASHYASWSGAVGLHRNLTRRLVLEAQVFYYGHRFDQAVLRVPGLVSGLNRQGARIGVTWHPPAVH
jgi:hypothetical protein